MQAWSDPLATWHHDAAIKIPAGVDVELMFTEGRLLLQRVQRPLPRKETAGRETPLKAAIAAARDTRRPAEARLAALAGAGLGELFDGPPAARDGHLVGSLPGLRRPSTCARRQLV